MNIIKLEHKPTTTEMYIIRYEDEKRQPLKIVMPGSETVQDIANQIGAIVPDNRLPMKEWWNKIKSHFKKVYKINYYKEYYKGFHGRKPMVFLAVTMYELLVDFLRRSVGSGYLSIIETYGIMFEGYSLGADILAHMIPLICSNSNSPIEYQISQAPVQIMQLVGIPKSLSWGMRRKIKKKYPNLDITTYHYGNDGVLHLGLPWNRHIGNYYHYRYGEDGKCYFNKRAYQWRWAPSKLQFGFLDFDLQNGDHSKYKLYC